MSTSAANPVTTAPGTMLETGDRFIDIHAVRDRTGMCLTWIEDAVRKRVRSGVGDFPLPVKIGKATRWLESEVLGWMNDQAARFRRRTISK